MNNPEVERAAEVMLRDPLLTFDGYARALSAAGLLRTEADRLNAELAEAMVAYCETYGFRTGITLERDGPARDRVRAAIVAILDSRKPVERWTSDGCWLKDGTTATTWTLPSKAHAAAAAKALNAEERAK